MIHRSWLLPPNWLGFSIVILIVLGVFLRFSNLDLKVYWVDYAVLHKNKPGYLS